MHIHYLAMVGKIDEIRQHLSKKPELLNVLEEDSCNTPLMVAISSNKLAIAKFLLSFGNIDIYAKDRDGKNILHFLLLEISDAQGEARRAYYDILETILQLDARYRVHNPKVIPLLEAQDKSGHSPLIMVSSSKNDEIRHTILDMAKKAQELVQLELRAQEVQKEEARLKLYSKKFPSVLRMGHGTKKSFFYFSLFGIWGASKRATTPTSPDLESKSLLEKKMV